MICEIESASQSGLKLQNFQGTHFKTCCTRALEAIYIC